MADGITAEGAVLQINTGTTMVPVWTPIIERAQLVINKTGESIDMTSFDSDGFFDRRPGLRSISLDASGNYVPTDAGWDALEDAWLDGETVEIRGLWRLDDGGQQGWQFNAVVTNVGETGNVGDKVEGALAFEGAGRPTKVTIPAGS